MFAVPVMHPAFTFRQPAALGPLSAHVQGFVARSLHGLPPAPKLELDPPASRLTWLINQCLKKKKGLAVDVETGEYGKLPGFAKLRAIGVGADLGNGIGLSWFYPCRRSVWMEFKRACEMPELVKVFTNGYAYDIPVLRRYGIETR